jgi:hypothetical protein
LKSVFIKCLPIAYFVLVIGGLVGYGATRSPWWGLVAVPVVILRVIHELIK